MTTDLPSLTYHAVDAHGQTVYGAYARTPVSELVKRLFDAGYQALSVKLGDDFAGAVVGCIERDADGTRSWWAL